MYYAYILKSKVNTLLYYGYTTNLKKRFTEHNSGLVKSTKSCKPWELAFYGSFNEMKTAKDFEKYLKSGSGKAFAYKRLVKR